MSLTPKLEADLAALRADLESGAAASVPVVEPDWWRPGAADVAKMGVLYGRTAAELFGDSQTPITPEPNYDETTFKLRTAFGFASSGIRLIWTVRDLQLARDFSDRVNAAPDASKLNALVANGAAEGVATDAVIAATMLNQVSVDPYSFQSPIYKVPGPKDSGYFPARTLEDVYAAMLLAWPIGPQGPSGR